MKNDRTLGFLGFGNMGEAIAEGLINNGILAANQMIVYDIEQAKVLGAKGLGARVADSALDLVAECDVLVLAVKPQSMGDALEQIKAGITADILVISIAAGLSLKYFHSALGSDMHVIRVMPNTPAMVGAGATAITASSNCTVVDTEVAKTIFNAVGVAEMIPENEMDSATALSASGPAYFFYMVECLIKGAVAEGLGLEQATRLATQTLLGAGRLLAESGVSASELRERVTSKGGTTAAALASFRNNKFEDIVCAAVRAGANRSRELSGS